MTRFFLTPLVHPSAIIQGSANLEPAQKTYLRRVADNPTPTLIDISHPPKFCTPDPTLDELDDFTNLAIELGYGVSIDIENAGPHLICCGAVLVSPATFEPSLGVCWRFRHHGGAPWWPTFEETRRSVVSLYRLLAAPTVLKIGHFAVQHDFPFLRQLGFVIAGPLLDTSGLLHATHAELPKGLQFSATLFCGAPRWKDVPDEKETEVEEEEGEE